MEADVPCAGAARSGGGILSLGCYPDGSASQVGSQLIANPLSVVLCNDGLIGIFGSYFKLSGIRGIPRGHPQGAGHSVYADGDCPI